MKVRYLPFLITLIITAAACKQKAPATTTDTPITDTSASLQEAAQTVPVEVVLRVSGAAHLADGMKPPVIIVPNFKKDHHIVLLLALPDFVAPSGLPNKGDQFDDDDLDSQGHPKKLATYMFGEIAPGVELDLEKSIPRVVFQAGAQFDPGDSSNDECPRPTQGSTTDATSLHWLPRLWKVSKATQPFVLKTAFTEKDPNPDVVNSRLEVRGGTLEAELSPQRRIFAFQINGRPGADDIKQVVSMSLVYKFIVNLPETDQVFTLRGRKFKTDGTHPGDLVDLGKFKPMTDPATGKLRIHLDLINVPEKEFFHLHDTQTIAHFDLHYRLVEGQPKKAFPKLVDKCGTTGGRPLFECGPTH
jgi:hypothetical protein